MFQMADFMCEQEQGLGLRTVHRNLTIGIEEIPAQVDTISQHERPAAIAFQVPREIQPVHFSVHHRTSP
jgi:hypothetical protein